MLQPRCSTSGSPSQPPPSQQTFSVTSGHVSATTLGGYPYRAVRDPEPRAASKKRIARVEAIAFDVYGTLFDITGERWGAPGVVATMRQKQLQYSWLVSLMGAHLDFREVTRRAIDYAPKLHGIDGDIDLIMASQLSLRTFPETNQALERLGRGRRLAILSNGHPDSLEALLLNAGLRDRFSSVVSADEVRIFKPAPAVYRRLLEVLGIDRERVLFVSSNAFDVAGATNFGLRVAWVNRSHLPLERVGGTPELEVANLSELVERL